MARTKRVRAGRPSIVSDEVRRKLFKKHFDEGYSAEDIFRNNKDTIGRRTAYRLVADFKQNYDWRRVSRPQRVRASAHEWFLTILKQVIDARPSAYLDEIKRVLRVQYRTSLSTSSICRYVHAPAPRGLGYSLLVLERRAINKDYSERQRFLQMMASGQFPPEQLIFVDECHKSNCLAQHVAGSPREKYVFLTLTRFLRLAGRHEARRRRGYGFRGQRIQLHEPFQNDSNFTLLAAFNANGFVVPACLITPATVDTAAWTAWAHACLCPVLGDYSKGEPNSVLVLLHQKYTFKKCYYSIS